MHRCQLEDARWRKFGEREWRCSSCGLMHPMPLDLACDNPDFWQESAEKSPNSAVLTSDNILTEDFCTIDGQHYFVRCVLELPLVGWSGETFGFGVWSTLSKKNFALYHENFDSGLREAMGPWFGWFSNRLKGYPDTLNLKCQVYPQEGRQRPRVTLEPTDHPLAVEQRTGITFDRLLELYALNGHDLRDALAS
jgi:hypothetical protein